MDQKQKPALSLSQTFVDSLIYIHFYSVFIADNQWKLSCWLTQVYAFSKNLKN